MLALPAYEYFIACILFSCLATPMLRVILESIIENKILFCLTVTLAWSDIPCQQQSKSDFEIINGFILFNLHRPGKLANPSHSNLRKLKCTDWHSINFQHFSAYYELVASPFISEICSISSLGARGRPVKGSTGRSSLRPPFRSSARIGGGGNSPALKRRR